MFLSNLAGEGVILESDIKRDPPAEEEEEMLTPHPVSNGLKYNPYQKYTEEVGCFFLLILNL